jgi:ribonuclease P/MRP protein subunit POP7
MAKETPPNATPKQLHKKLPRLDKSTYLPTSPMSASQLLINFTDQRISKRPLSHPAVAPARSNASVQKVVYISASTPFIAAVKRVRKLLSRIEDRAAGPVSLSGNPAAALRSLRAAVDRKCDVAGGGGAKRSEEVVMKATGKAIEKAMQLALYWQGQEDVLVRVRTGSVGAVDDVVGVGSGDGGEVEESRVRRVSCLEVAVILR